MFEDDMTLAELASTITLGDHPPQEQQAPVCECNNNTVGDFRDRPLAPPVGGYGVTQLYGRLWAHLTPPERVGPFRQDPASKFENLVSMNSL